jgi:hypothetical protein
MSVTATGSLELAQARIGARWGEQPGDATWRRIEATRDLAGVLDIARSDAALSRWVDGIGADASLHALERTLRRQGRERVAELRGWMPTAWQAAVAWCALLPDLPALQHLARGHTAAAWMHADDALRPCLEGRPSNDARLALLASARADPSSLLARWRDRWLALLPREAGRARVECELLPLLEGHALDFASPRIVDGRGARDALRRRLVLLLRRASCEPVAAFVYLATQMLDLERLRGELVQRAAFPALALAP